MTLFDHRRWARATPLCEFVVGECRSALTPSVATAVSPITSVSSSTRFRLHCVASATTLKEKPASGGSALRVLFHCRPLALRSPSGLAARRRSFSSPLLPPALTTRLGPPTSHSIHLPAGPLTTQLTRPIVGASCRKDYPFATPAESADLPHRYPGGRAVSW
jgi:hypothetical protein